MIRKLQSDSLLDGFVLVGGTGLALQIGHRTSVDIDFFTRKEFDPQLLLQHLEHKYGFKEQYQYTNTLKGIIDETFVDFITHDYDYIEEPIMLEYITLASKKDIAAMKVNVIAGNGTRVKDFVDMYFLLKEFDFSEIIDFYQTKYKSRNAFHAVKSLTFFEDIIPVAWPVMLKEKELSLDELKKSIITHRDMYLRSRQG